MDLKTPDWLLCATWTFGKYSLLDLKGTAQKKVWSPIWVLTSLHPWYMHNTTCYLKVGNNTHARGADEAKH